MLNRLLTLLLLATLIAGCASAPIDPRTLTNLRVTGTLTTPPAQPLPAGLELHIQVHRYSTNEAKLLVDYPLVMPLRDNSIDFDFGLPSPQDPATVDLLSVVAFQHQRPRYSSSPVALQITRNPVDAGLIPLQHIDLQPFGRPYQCGPARLLFGNLGGEPRMALNGQLHILRAGGGSPQSQRYWSHRDRNTQLVDQGERLLVVVGGRRLPDCLPVDSAALPLSARGQEPNWYLHLSSQLIQFEEIGEADSRFSAPLVGQRFLGNELQLFGADQFQPLLVRINQEICRDSQGVPAPYQVTIERNGETFNGCGGDLSQLLVGQPWKINRLAGRPPQSRAPMTLALQADGQLLGRSPCNRFIGNWTLQDNQFKVSQLSATRMSCRAGLNDQEHNLFRVLKAVTELDFDSSGALLLKGDQGVIRAVSHPSQL